MAKHQHHVIPKHQGGSDDKSNLIELSIEEHAEAHRLLYEKYGHWEDYVAWKGLAGMMSREEIIHQVQSQAAKDRIRLGGNPTKGWLLNSEQLKSALLAAQSPEASAKRKATFAKKKHAQGTNNSQFGKQWITDGLKSIRIIRGDSIPAGFRPGRVLSK